MGLLLLYWGILIGFYILAGKLRGYKERFSFLEKLLNFIIYILVFVMGLRMGANEEVTSNLSRIGLQSAGLSIFAMGGSVLAVSAVRKILGMNREGVISSDAFNAVETKEESIEEGGQDSGFKTSLIILACVALGMAGGYVLIPALFENLQYFRNISGDFMVVSICALLALVGFNMGLEGKVLDNLKTVGVKALLIPTAAIVGSLVLGAVYGVLSALSVKESVAISAGFGWYTLAPSIITDAGFAVAGAVSFMHNVIRETVGIVIIPLAARRIGYLEATSIPGVAAMDVCLPIVERSCGSNIAVYSFCTGALMSAVVPVVVPLIIG